MRCFVTKVWIKIYVYVSLIFLNIGLNVLALVTMASRSLNLNPKLDDLPNFGTFRQVPTWILEVRQVFLSGENEFRGLYEGDEFNLFVFS